MSSDTDTPNIDEVKNTANNSSLNYVGKFSLLVSSIITRIVHLFIYVIIAGYILYTCKVSQSNLLPTETACKPYTNAIPTIKPIKTNIFEIFFSDPPVSQKLHFPYGDNDRNIILDAIRQLKENPTSTCVGAYIMSILQGGLTLNYVFFDVFFNLLNQLPEFLILLFGPFLLTFFLTILFLISMMNTFITWFTQLHWFFKKNTNDKLSGVPIWSDITFLQPFEWVVSLALMIFFASIGMTAIIALLPIITIVLLILTLFSLNSYRGILNGEEIGLIGIIIKLFVYYKVPITVFIAIITIMNAYSILGSAAGFFCIVTVFLIYWGIISFDLFKSIPEKHLSPMVSKAQASKTCSAGVIQAGGNKHLSNINDKNFNSKLKQISKQLTSKKNDM